MRNVRILLLLSLLPLLSGCGTLPRALTDAVMGAGGALLGNKLSHGNPWATAGGAAGGVLLGEGIQSFEAQRQQQAADDGYTRGRSDGAKQRYWDLQNQQREPNNSAPPK
jgi:hypothetical protein